MKYYIYKIENKVNHKKYIGLTSNIERRRARHFTDLRCNRHDNHFMQKEFNIYGEENFTFNIEFEGDVSVEEISQKEREYIAYYDSYKNGYNQNEGGNFGPSNGGSTLTQSDIFNILAALEFMTNKRPGQVLSDIFHVSKTTISRIKHKVNHLEDIEEYYNMPIEQRQDIFNIFEESYHVQERYADSSKIKSKRKLAKEQVLMILCNYEYKIIPEKHMANLVGVKSTYTLDCIEQGKSYQDYSILYNQLTDIQKQKIVSLIRENQK